MGGSFMGRETNPAEGATAGSIAGATASGLTTPLDVAKTRIMLEKPVEGMPKKYTGAIQTITAISSEEGVLALFKGIVPRVSWITIGGFVFFGAYESAQEVLWKTGVW